MALRERRERRTTGRTSRNESRVPAGGISTPEGVKGMPVDTEGAAVGRRSRWASRRERPRSTGARGNRRTTSQCPPRDSRSGELLARIPSEFPATRFPVSPRRANGLHGAQ